ncbi:hypothetical protein [Enemella evansiae]|nr:hypothetical protein [Enemella evansiae]
MQTFTHGRLWWLAVLDHGSRLGIWLRRGWGRLRCGLGNERA